MKKPQLLTALACSILAGAAVVSIVTPGWWRPARQHATVSSEVSQEEPQALAPVHAAPLARQPDPCWLPALAEETRLALTAFPSVENADEAFEDAADGPQLLLPDATSSPLTQDPPAIEESHAASTNVGKSKHAPPASSPPGQRENASAQQAIRPPAGGPDVNRRPDVAHAAVEEARSEALEQIAREADAHTRSGFSLAGRGAHFSARAEFIVALRLVAQGLDRQRQTTQHSQSLADGLNALAEAEDFLPGGSHLEADLDLESILAGHRTPLLKSGNRDQLTPLSALQQYLTYAQGRLAAAAESELAGSMALYALGKLHATLAAQKNDTIRVSAPKAMVFYQAALLVFPKNHLASNDLGVLLGQAGRFEQARIALEHSVSVQSQPENWQNLAKVYAQLGAPDLALRAQRQSQALLQTGAARQGNGLGRTGIVQWVDPQSFRDPASPAAPPSASPVVTAARPMPAPPDAQWGPTVARPLPLPANAPAAPPFAAPQPSAWSTPWAPPSTRGWQMPYQYRK